MKRNNIFLFIPDNLERNKSGYMTGYIHKKNREVSFYVINNKLQSNRTHDSIGYCAINERLNELTTFETSSPNWINIKIKSGRFILYNIVREIEDHVVTCIFYNYEAFIKSDMVLRTTGNFNGHFGNIAHLIKDSLVKKECTVDKPKSFAARILRIFINIFLIVCDVTINTISFRVIPHRIFSTVEYLNNNFLTLRWALKGFVKEGRVNVRIGNVLVARLSDFIMGLCMLFWCLQYESNINIFLRNSIEDVINGLRELLKILMGSPVGLKLNYAFNTTLGNFFLYHIELWKTFLHTVSPLLSLSIKLLKLPAALGLTFQVSLLMDFLALVTFHIYCIYVYAARLYGLQILGLLSLWRLFLGRKFNPLRNRVDSYQYSHHQLFIGTLAFTILLFLLPTTLLYYTVFTTLRLGLLLLQRLLSQIRHILQYLPLFVTYLWVVNAPQSAGMVHLEISKQPVSGADLTLNANLRKQPWWETVNNSLPETIKPVQGVSWSSIVNSVITSNSILK